MEPIAWRHLKVIKARGQINILQLSGGSLRDVRLNTFALARGVQVLSTSIRERLYHWPSVTRHVTRGKREFVPPNAPMSGAEVHSTELSAPLAGSALLGNDLRRLPSTCVPKG